MLSKKKSLEYCYKNYKGSGNINSDLWIFGFEPGGDPLVNSQDVSRGNIENADEKSFIEYLNKIENADEKSFIEYLNKPLDDKIEGNTYYIIKDLVEKFNRKNCLNQSGTKFNINADSDVFYSNLFPLKFPAEKDQRNLDILNFYREHFNDIEPSDPNERKFYKDCWILERFMSQFSEFNKGEKRVIIITKTNYDDKYLTLLFCKEGYEQKEPYKIKYGNGETTINQYKKANTYVYFIPNRKDDNITKIVFDEARDKLNIK
ncbi:MAG: hypothetical protein N3D80_12770 [Ignavibacterium album]|uniref:hypothetical protein n=1 Tax=Ignavibacterium album TaxID=591197 RepID=UPI0026ECB69B|nr:hypothetical protein [Ignavibacterium album]MCX8106733.1 hypothetical protein [Ignavibacterium album]